MDGVGVGCGALSALLRERDGHLLFRIAPMLMLRPVTAVRSGLGTRSKRIGREIDRLFADRPRAESKRDSGRLLVVAVEFVPEGREAGPGRGGSDRRGVAGPGFLKENEDGGGSKYEGRIATGTAYIRERRRSLRDSN